jgi:predicted component of type VI protein secretion system
LEVIAGNGAGSDIHVDDELVIGRHAEGAGRLSDDSEISRQHARLAREVTGDYAIEDLGSSNGTFVNGLRLAAPQLLAEGDSIEVGATTLLVHVIAPEPPEPLAPSQEPAPGAAPTIFTTTEEPAPGPAPTIFARSPALPDPTAASASTAEPVGDVVAAVARDDDLAPPADAAAARAPRLTLTLEIDFEAREAAIALDDHADDPIRLVLEDGRWRMRSADR